MNSNKKIKIVFLDVDGVLNTHNDDFNSRHGLNESICLIFEKFLDETGSKIVLTSTWKRTPEAIELLKKRFGEDSIISLAPDLKAKVNELYELKKGHNTRTDEILLWLFYNDTNARGFKNSPLLTNIKESELSIKPIDWHGERIDIFQFVIFDDLNLLEEGCLGYLLRDNFVHINPMIGLDVKYCDMAKKILESKLSDEWRKKAFETTHCPSHNPEQSLMYKFKNMFHK